MPITLPTLAPRAPFRAAPLLLPLLAFLLASHPTLAQETESPLSPAGRLRLQVAPAFVAWDSRYGEEGSEPLGADLDVGETTAFFPGVPNLETGLRALLDDPEYSGSLGRTQARVSADRLELPLRVDVGVFDWLTVGATVPLVKGRTEITLDFDSAGANLGGNPVLTDLASVAAYVDGLNTAGAAASGRADEVCASEPESEACSSAMALADDLGSFNADLSEAYRASFLFPTTESAAGTTLRERSDALDGRLVEAGLEGLAGTLPLAEPLPDRAAFDDFVASAFAMPSPALGNPVELWELGDVELHAVVQLLEGVRRDSTDERATARWQVGAGGLVRLGTGSRDDPAVLLDHPAGDGQTDLEGRLFANLVWHRLGLWTDIRYGVQLSTNVTRRVGPSGLPFLAPRGLSLLKWTPGSYLRLEVAPRVHLTGELAVSAGYHLWSKAQDSY
ncbi:MAG: hypothetical protein PVI57_13830, partial [Gemmatimonadota bacterium]